MITPEVDTEAKILWDYMQLHEHPVKSDLIFCLGSHDTRVADRAAELFLDGLGGLVVFSGGVGSLTKDLFTQPEAAYFAEIAVKAGVPSDRIIIEDKAANTGENIRFTYEILAKRGQYDPGAKTLHGASHLRDFQETVARPRHQDNCHLSANEL
jgi:hypothetical protein